MKHTAAAAKELTIDPGCLPSWEVDDLPEAPPPNYRKWWLLIGPGLVMAGGSIGTGEWVMGAQAAAQYRGAFFWVVLLSIFGQVCLNTEAMRYTLCTGEPLLTGFLRTRPGPRFWILFYLLLDFGTWLPSLSALAAQILVVAVYGLTPADSMTPEMIERVRMFSYLVFMGSAALVLFGGKVYNTLEWVLGGKFLIVLGYCLVCSVFFVSLRTWGEIWGGLVNPFRTTSKGIDWSLISALAGFSGIGGLGNMMASNYVREKGWGMGSKVGAIPSAFGGHKIRLSHLGTRCRGGREAARRLGVWWKYLVVDQYLLWAGGSLIGMMLPSLMGAEFLRVERLTATDHWRWAAAMAQDFGEQHGQIFRHLTLFVGLVIFIPGQFSVVDGVARRWCDAIWSGSASARKMDTGRVKWIYYSFAGLYVAGGLVALTVLDRLSGAGMMKIAGSMANLSIAMTMLHVLYVNQRFLPAEVRPSRVKRLALNLSAVFFLTMFALVVIQKVMPVIAENMVPTAVGSALLIVVMANMAITSADSVRRQRQEWGPEAA